ncbi:MAG: TetR/AcrR family transcriptional regulator [Salinivirgaceae bacterium]|nr:TetR/AcrR family transcriptional regulator [Salinivirgaceae bacterium]
MINKRDIIEKSAKLFKIFGIKSNTMDDIAREIGISKKTLYQHVADKKELIQLVIDDEQQKNESQILSIKENSENEIEELIRINVLIIKFLQNINPAGINDLRKHFKQVYEKAKASYQELFSIAIKENLKMGKNNKIYRPDLNEELITQIHISRIDKIHDANDLWGVNASTPELIKEMTNYYIRGLITTQGEILLNKYIVEFNKYLNE